MCHCVVTSNHVMNEKKKVLKKLGWIRWRLGKYSHGIYYTSRDYSSNTWYEFNSMSRWLRHRKRRIQFHLRRHWGAGPCVKRVKENFWCIWYWLLGRTVTISRGCRQSAFAGAVSGNGVGVSTSSQSCSTDLCNTGDGLGPSINFPGFNTNVNNGFGFSSGSNTNFNSGASALGAINCNANFYS